MRVFKKICMLITLLLFLFPILSSKVRAASTKLEFTYTEASDDTITIQIYLTPGGNTVNTITADFTYPSDLLEATSLKTTDSLCDNFVRHDYSTDGVVYITCSSNDDITEEGAVATVTFKALSSGDAELKFSDDAAVFDANTSEDILAETESGNYTINSDLSILPQTGISAEPRIFFALLVLTILVMLIVLTLVGFTLWGGIYLSLGKWKFEGKYEVGVGKGKKKGKKEQKTAKRKSPKEE